MVIADFELKDAFIEGAKAARNGLESAMNPFAEFRRRSNWNAGYKTVISGSLEPVSYLPVSGAAYWSFDTVPAAVAGTHEVISFSRRLCSLPTSHALNSAILVS